MIRDKDMQVFLELLRNSHRSDRQLAKDMGVSQPTVTRARSRLEKGGLIRQYTIMPNFVEMGFQIVAITCFKSKRKRELLEKAKRVTMSIPNIIFAARAEGMGKNGVVISLHQTYRNYANFITKLMFEHGEEVEEYGSMLISLGEECVVKPLSLKYLTELYE